MTMPRKRVDEQELLDKIRSLPPERIAEVDDFVDFLKHRDEDQRLVRAASKISEGSFSEAWGSDDDDDYDER